MNVQLKGRHVTDLQSLEQEIKRKVKRFDRLLGETTYVEVCLQQLSKAKAGGDKEAEILVDIPGRKVVIRFVCVAESCFGAGVLALEKDHSMLSQEKDKLVDHGQGRRRQVKEQVADAANQAEL